MLMPSSVSQSRESRCVSVAEVSPLTITCWNVFDLHYLLTRVVRMLQRSAKGKRQTGEFWVVYWDYGSSFENSSTRSVIRSEEGILIVALLYTSPIPNLQYIKTRRGKKKYNLNLILKLNNTAGLVEASNWWLFFFAPHRQTQEVKMESKKLISFQTYDKMLECVRGNFYSSRDLGVLTLDLKKVQISVLVYKKCLMGLRPGFCAITRIYKSCFAQWDTAMMEQQKAC